MAGKYPNLVFWSVVVSIALFVSASAAAVPATFQQSPFLEDPVAEGELPSVDDRLPRDPYVVETGDIGVYGGTVESATLDIRFGGEDMHFMDFVAGLTKVDPALTDAVPNFAKDIEMSEDGTTFTVYLREGVKWSDGHPFTTEDVMFWYEDILLNEDLTPVVGDTWRAGGETAEVEAVSDYEFTVTFAEAKPFFLVELTKAPEVVNNPKHYLKQFHPNYTDEDELAAMVSEEGFDSWYELFQQRNEKWMSLPLHPDLPTLLAYDLVALSSTHRSWERNPYFWKVDREGNQLPYIDRIETTLVADREILTGMIMSGEIDFARFRTDIRDYSVLRQYEEEGNFNSLLWPSDGGNAGVIMLNLTHNDPFLRETFQNDQFRKALSLAIDREEINDVLFYGQGVPRQHMVLEEADFVDSAWAESYVEFDPERAEAMLDDLGFVDQSGDGWRDRPDGDSFTFTLEYIDAGLWPQVSELVEQQWADIGIDLNVRFNSHELQSQRAPANEQDALIWSGAGPALQFAERGFEYVPTVPRWECTRWPAWALWFESDGESGMEPPEEIKELRSWLDAYLGDPDPAVRNEYAKKILQSQAENLWSIGTVGRAPGVATANQRLRNVPEDLVYGWAAPYTSHIDPENWFFDGGSRR